MDIRLKLVDNEIRSCRDKLVEIEIMKCKEKLTFLKSSMITGHSKGICLKGGAENQIKTQGDAGIEKRRPLIISTGDISDVDGFYALAQYAQSGADVLFIMNFPAYLGKPSTMESDDREPEGRGFAFNTEEYFKVSDETIKSMDGYEEKKKKYFTLRDRYTSREVEGDKFGIKQAFSDLGFEMASRVWNETPIQSGGKGKLFYCIGGINEISPFSTQSLKNEIFVYADVIFQSNFTLGSYSETSVFDSLNTTTSVPLKDVFKDRDCIYMDFNGSMAFYTGELRERIRECRRYIKGVFVMGGVFSYEASKTMPKIKGTLNRFSCATMNQLYSPVQTELFFNDIYEHSSDIQLLIVTNNVVDEMKTSVRQLDKAGREVEVLTDEGWINFIRSNGIFSDFLMDIASMYYNSHYRPPRKAFDFYTAFALTEHMKGKFIHGALHFMYTDQTYGVCMVSNTNSPWKTIADEYYDKIDMKAQEGDSAFVVQKKQNFIVEKNAVSRLPITKNRVVRALWFTLDKQTFKLSMQQSP